MVTGQAQPIHPSPFPFVFASLDDFHRCSAGTIRCQMRWDAKPHTGMDRCWPPRPTPFGNGMMPCPSSESSLLHLQSNQEKGCHLPIRMWVCVCLHTSQALATPVTRQQLPYSYFAPEARRPLSVKGTVALDATTDLEEAKAMSDRFTNGTLISSCSSVAASGNWYQTLSWMLLPLLGMEHVSLANGQWCNAMHTG